MIRLRILPVLLLGLFQQSGAAQTLRVESAAPVAAEKALTYVAYPLTALTPLDARLQQTARGVRLVLVGDTLDFEAGSPFYRHRGRVMQLPQPVVARGDVLLVPRVFFTEHLPRALASQLSWSDGRLVRTAVAGAVTLVKDTSRRVPVATPSRDTSRQSAPASAAKDVAKPAARKNLNRIVIIDAGHGGKDPGKPGPNGLLEKNVALTVSNRLAGFLRERGYEVHLTRTRDTLIALDDRPHLANEWKKGRPSALFVSVHANSAVRSARGFETFFLSDARTDDERRVAEMENEVVKFEERPNQAAPELDLIVSSLKNDYYLRASSDLATTIQQHIATVHPGPNRGVKRAGFRVLVGALMPSVLVELAFISNPEEARLLGTSAFQQKIAFSLAEAIANYFDSYEHLWTQN